MAARPAVRLGRAAAAAALAGIFLWSGIAKAMHPLRFLAALQPYGLDPARWPAIPIAAFLPWAEIFLGATLLAPRLRRAAALVAAALLAVFTALVAARALALESAHPTPFCSLAFDCGCGQGVVFVCPKLAENLGLLVLAAWLASAPTARAPISATPRS